MASDKDLPVKREDSTFVTHAIEKLISSIPHSDEPSAMDPRSRAQHLAKTAAIKAAGVSASLSLPAGPIALLTVIPDLLGIWHIQRQLVADIAAVYGKTPALTRESMIYCLFRHGGAALVRDLVARVGERYIIRQAGLRIIQEALEKIGVRVSQRVLGRTLSRWIPIVGAVGVGAYAYYDTTQVATNAIELFSSEVEVEKK